MYMFGQIFLLQFTIEQEPCANFFLYMLGYFLAMVEEGMIFPHAIPELGPDRKDQAGAGFCFWKKHALPFERG